MYHSVYFGDKNTWDDWHLVANSRPVLLPPTVKTNYIDIPGSDGHVDLTTSLTGEPTYNTRTGSITFYVMNGYHEWYHIYSEIMNYLHGQEMKIILEDDPWFYYTGRFSVNTWQSNKDRSTIVINYDISPYKYVIQSSSEDWLWDPFDFEVGIIREYSNIRIDGTVTMDIYGGRKTIIPSFITKLDNASSPIMMTWSKISGNNFVLENGTIKLPDIKIKDEVTQLTFKGKGIVSIDYRGGSL